MRNHPHFSQETIQGGPPAVENQQQNVGEGINLNPDLDKLSNPDEASAIPGSLNLGILPNLDPPAAENQVEDTGQQENNQQQNQSQNNYQQNNQQDQQESEGEAGVYDVFLEQLTQRYGDKFRINMDGLDETNVMDRIEEAIINARGAKANLHPEVQKLQEALESGVDINDYYKKMQASLTIEGMPSKDLVKMTLQQNYGKSERRPNGWDDAKIQATIDKMEASGVLELEAEKIRDAYEDNRRELLTQMKNQAHQQKLENLRKMDDLRNREVEAAIKYFGSLKDINGIQLTQSDHAAFAEDFRYATTPNPQTGRSPLYDALQSNENLAKVFWFLSKGDAEMRKALTLAKEGAKNDFIQKLDKIPKTPQKTAPHIAGEINFDALVEPENYGQ